MSQIKFCENCDNYLYHKVSDINNSVLTRKCLNCNNNQKDENGGLVVETRIQERSSEGYKILLNEFTEKDPTLPHVKNIKCPNSNCISNEDEKQRDVIYIKYDAVNLKFIYICTKCKERWRSR